MDANSEDQIEAAQNNSRIHFIWECKLNKKYQNITVFIVIAVVIFRVVWLSALLVRLTISHILPGKLNLWKNKSPKRNFHSFYLMKWFLIEFSIMTTIDDNNLPTFKMFPILLKLS